MDGNIIFQILAAFIFALFALVFLVVYLYDRQYKSCGWLSAAFTLALAAFFTDISRNISILPLTLLTNTLFWAANGAIAVGICVGARRAFPLRSFIALLLFGYASNFYFTWVTPDLVWRSSFSNLVAAGIVALCLPALYRNRWHWMVRAIFWCIASMAAMNFLRPVFAFGIFGFEYQTVNYSSSSYSLILHATSAATCLAMGVIILMAVGLDIVVKLQRESDTDHLTGLRNQRGIASLIEGYEVDQDDALSKGRAILIFDIDHFKQINDEYGHDVGDLVLIKIGRTIRQLMKYHGIAGRSGGEEFIFIFSRESSQAAFLVSEHLRVALGLLNHSQLPEAQRITVSMGLAFVREGEAIKRTLRRADTALYQAKDEGRNRLRLADGDTLPDPDETRLMPRVSTAKGDIGAR